MSSVVANTVSLVILLIFIRKRWLLNRSLLEPGILFAGNLILLYPLRGLVLLGFEGTVTPIYPELLAPEALEASCWLAVIGCVGFCLGYLTTAGKRKLKILETFQGPVGQQQVRTCGVFFVASLIGVAYKFVTGDYISYLISDTRITPLTQIGNLLTGLQWPTYIGVWVLWFSRVRTPQFFALFAAVHLVIVPYQFLQGSKTFLSLLVVSIVISYYWSRGRIPKAAAIAAAAFIVFFVFPFVIAFRDFVNVQYGGIPRLSALDLDGLSAIPGSDKPGDDSLKTKLLDVSTRYAGIDELYNITQFVPSPLPYRLASPYFAVIVNMVPRALWPDKPIFSRGAVYGGALGAITSVTPFPFGEAYWDFGIPGLVISMYAWGALLGGLLSGYARLYRRGTLSFFFGIYFLSQLYWIAGGESSMPEVIGGLPQQFALLLILSWVLGLTAQKHETTRISYQL